MTVRDALPDAGPYKALLGKVDSALFRLGGMGQTPSCRQVAPWVFCAVDLTISEQDAARHYAQVSAALVRDLTQVTGQSAAPLIVVTQGGGFRDNGRVEAVLAEGRFDLDNPGVRAIVATPSYPWPLMPDTPATPSPISALIMDELCDLAVHAVQSGNRWFCPSLQAAYLDGQQILAEFSSLDGLELAEGRHGFRLDGGDQELPEITGAEVISERFIRLHLAEVPEATNLHLSYAWGHDEAEHQGEYTANHGAVRDRWQADSRAVPGQTLYRYALSGRVPLLRKG